MGADEELIHSSARVSPLGEPLAEEQSRVLSASIRVIRGKFGIIAESFRFSDHSALRLGGSMP